MKVIISQYNTIYNQESVDKILAAGKCIFIELNQSADTIYEDNSIDNIENMFFMIKEQIIKGDNVIIDDLIDYLE